MIFKTSKFSLRLSVVMPCCFHVRTIVLLVFSAVCKERTCQKLLAAYCLKGKLCSYGGNFDPCRALTLPEPGDPPLPVSSGLCHPPRQLSVSLSDVKKQNTTLDVNQFWKIETGFMFHGFDVLSRSCKTLPLFGCDWQDLPYIFE